MLKNNKYCQLHNNIDFVEKKIITNKKPLLIKNKKHNINRVDSIDLISMNNLPPQHQQPSNIQHNIQHDIHQKPHYSNKQSQKTQQQNESPLEGQKFIYSKQKEKILKYIDYKQFGLFNGGGGVIVNSKPSNTNDNGGIYKDLNLNELDEISSWSPNTIVDFNKRHGDDSLPSICSEIDFQEIKTCEGSNYYRAMVTPTPVLDENSMNYTLKPNSQYRAKFNYYPREFSKQPLITILTAFYNIEPDIFEESAATVFGQSLQNFEWVIVNDCSPNQTLVDLSLGKYRELAKIDPRIVIIDLKKNVRLPGARNAGVKVARGKYIVSLDPDDMFENTYLEKAVWFLETHKEYTLCNAWTVGFANKSYVWKNGYHNGDRNLKENQITVASVMRTQALRDVGGFDSKLIHGMEDWDLWIRMADNGHWGHTLEEFHFWYRVSPPGKWDAIDNLAKFNAFLENQQVKYKNAYGKGVPKLSRPPQEKMEAVDDLIPFENNLKKCRPRVLLLIPYMEVGGADQFNYNFAQGMVLDGWEVSIATTKTSDNKWFPQFARVTPDIFIMPRFSKNTDQCRFLAYYIKSRQFDVVYVSNSEQAYHYLSYLRANAPGPAYIDYTHSETPKWKDGGYARYSFGSEKLLDRSIFASEHLRQYCIRRGHNANKTATVLIGIDSDKYVPKPENRAIIRKELGFPDNVLVIVFVARLESEKQPEVFAEVLRRVDEMGYDFRAISIGGGLLFNDLNETISKSGLSEKVRLLGNIPNSQVSKYVSGSDVFFLPSKVEGISLAIYEAMSQQVCAVSAKVGGQAELVTPDVGFLVVPGTPTEVDEYTEIIADLASNLTLASELGKKSLEKILNGFSVKDTLHRMKEEFCNSAIVTRYTTPMFTNKLFSKLSNEQAVLGHEYERAIDELLPMWNQLTSLTKQLAPPPTLTEKEIKRKPSPYPLHKPEEVLDSINITGLRVVENIMIEKKKVDRKMKIILKDFQEQFIRRNPKFADKQLVPNEFLHQYNHGVDNWDDELPYPYQQQEYVAYIPNAFVGTGESATIFDWDRVFLLNYSPTQQETFTMPLEESRICHVEKTKKMVTLLQKQFSFENFIIDQLPKLSLVLEELELDPEIKILVPFTDFAKTIMVDTLKFSPDRIIYFKPGSGWDPCVVFFANTLLLPTPIPPGQPPREMISKLRDYFYQKNDIDIVAPINRNVIMYASRKSTLSPLRKVSNEQKVIETIKNILQSQGEGKYEFIEWDGLETITPELVQLSSRVKILIGMTGANLLPMVVCQPNTIVVEFMHENPWLSFWSTSESLQHENWMIPIKATSHDSLEIQVPIDQLTNTLNQIFNPQQQQQQSSSSNSK
ncbi:hypothetical protein ACTFIT_001339 [Dictyostelium discoideum]